jgi:hypothetical protein
MRGIPSVVLFIALLPIIAAFGHDLYLFYANYGVESAQAVQKDIEQQIADKGADSFFASLGFIWTKYHPDSYKFIAENIDEGSWSVINWLLTQKAVVVGFVFAIFVFALTFILQALGVGGEEGSKSWDKGSSLSSGSRNKTGTFKYKRK